MPSTAAPYDGLDVETNDPLGQLVIKNTRKKKISLDDNLAKLFGTSNTLPLLTNIKHVMKTTAYFIHCDLIDKTICTVTKGQISWLSSM